MMKLKIMIFCIFVGMQVCGKSISIQIDTDDLLKIVKALSELEGTNFRKNPTARRDNFNKNLPYYNPYHPEDDNMNDKEISLFDTNKNLKKLSKVGFLDKENSRLEAKIENENKNFFEVTNDSKEDELTDNNAIEKNKSSQDENFSLDKNLSTYCDNFQRPAI